MKYMIAVCALAALGFGQNLTPVDDAGYSKLIAAHKGKVVLVNFWATYCKPCRAEMPALEKLAAKLKARGFDLITISNDEADKQGLAVKALAEYGVAGQTYWRKTADEDKFCDAIDPNWGGALPALFLYNRAGKKVKAFIGETPIPTIEAAIDKLL
ncbi:MAG TPA: TlpA disulfide reductase family protein [Bryobacteraceae bacterium]|nr:TlpA disulfide reductase family protein [Bryobacteraceae bacterium]